MCGWKAVIIDSDISKGAAFHHEPGQLYKLLESHFRANGLPDISEIRLRSTLWIIDNGAVVSIGKPALTLSGLPTTTYKSLSRKSHRHGKRSTVT